MQMTLSKKASIQSGIDPNRAKTREAREINREAKNTSSSARNFARLLNHNFDRKDRHITVTISPEGMTKIQRRADSIAAKIKAKGKETPNVRDLLHLAMERELENWNRRILDACKKTRESHFDTHLPYRTLRTRMACRQT